MKSTKEILVDLNKQVPEATAYQKFISHRYGRHMIKMLRMPNGNVGMSARDLHKYLNVKTPFNHWIPRTIKYCNLSDGIDYQEFLEHGHSKYGGRPRKCALLSLNAVKIICLFQRRNYRELALHFLGVKSHQNL